MDFESLFVFVCIAIVVGFFLMMFLVSKKIIHAPWFTKFCDRFLKIALTIFGLWTVAVWAGLSYRDADNHGWFSHKRVVSVLMSRDWMNTEFKNCTLSKDNVLFCDDDRSAAPHQLEVDFRGPLDSPRAYEDRRWNCQRKRDSIVCKSR
jgi:hypothetical protein